MTRRPAAATVLLVAALLALAGCTAATPSPDPAPTAVPSGPRCIEPAASPAASAAPSKGPALPAMALQCFEGGRWTPVSDLGGAPTIVNLWASWCEPCKTELPAVQRVATVGAGKVRVVGIVTKDRHEWAKSVIERQQLTFPMLEDPDQHFAVAVSPLVGKALINLPVTLFVTADGRIAHAYQGPALDEAELRELTQQYLGVAVPS
ncbi:TlpA family protein disulfide reductase [Dactylosporangium sucinum]|uniref:Thioredoxin domain-containing protein n=1 Tax=Dactylosporangium sucinum TaxID=1424081 RepID=A0A917TQQ8_9ACTN|nr:TlpA disulfide reductase family protein [Dactylosporangium sucinum]GGM33701.1 hypothetical protein GCM10007977_038940 [Dactylosporangium sucinum]